MGVAVKVYVLSKRHQERRWICDACDIGTRHGDAGATATLLVRDGERVVGELRICAPCLREAIHATEPK